MDGVAGHEAQLINQVDVHGVHHGQAQALALHPQGQDQLALAHRLGDQRQQAGVRLQLPQVDFLEHQLVPQQVPHLGEVHPVVLHQLPYHRGPVVLHFAV